MYLKRKKRNCHSEFSIFSSHLQNTASSFTVAQSWQGGASVSPERGAHAHLSRRFQGAALWGRPAEKRVAGGAVDPGVWSATGSGCTLEVPTVPPPAGSYPSCRQRAAWSPTRGHVGKPPEASPHGARIRHFLPKFRGRKGSPE